MRLCVSLFLGVGTDLPLQALPTDSEDVKAMKKRKLCALAPHAFRLRVSSSLPAAAVELRGGQSVGFPLVSVSVVGVRYVRPFVFGRRSHGCAVQRPADPNATVQVSAATHANADSGPT